MKNTYTYQLYQLIFESSIQLPHLRPVLQASKSISDVKIYDVSDINLLHQIDYQRQFPTLTYSIGSIGKQVATLIDLKNVARFLVIDGKEIRCQRYGNCAENDFQSYLCSLAIVAILFQRGYFILHASAIATPKGALMFFGKSGAGKTTTTAGFMQRNYKILSEDVTVIKMIDGQAHVLPAVPYLKLSKTTTTLLGLDWDKMPPLFSDQEKRAFVLNNQYQSQAIPLHSIYFLSVAQEVEELTFNTEIDYEEKFGLIADNIHYKKFFMGYPLDEIYSHSAIFLVENIPMTQVQRPLHKNTLSIWLDKIEQSFSDSTKISSIP